MTRGVVFAALVGVASCATITGGDPGARTPGVIIDDRGIERAVAEAIRTADERLAGSQIRVASFNGVVLLTGLVSDEALKQAAQRAVERDVRKVRRVHNELEVGPPVTNVSRVNDRWLGTKVRASLMGSEEVKAHRIKIVMRNGVAYLMGLVPRVAGDSAAHVASTVTGVQKVVKVFEYVDP